MKFALLSKLIFFFKAPLPLPVISFDSCGGNVSTIFQIFYFVTSKDQKSKKQISSSKKKDILGVIILGGGQTAGFGGLLLL